MGLEETQLSDTDINMFAKTLRFLAKKNIGIDIKPSSKYPTNTYSPFVRANEYFKQLFEYRMASDYYD